MSKVKLEIDANPSKIDALRVYLGHKNTSLEHEIAKHIDVLYNKNVPTAVREFLKENQNPERRSDAAKDHT